MNQDSAPETKDAIVSEKNKESGWQEFLSTIGILAMALVAAFFIISFVFRSYQVDGPSMEATLQNSDKLIIWKVPRTWARITGNDYIPKRGDIVVFNEKGLNQFNNGAEAEEKQLIKRVIGLPGERVVVRDGEVSIYNDERPGGFQPDKQLDYGREVNIPRTSGNFDITLAADQLFVMGDNRPESLDSRAFGPIKADQVVGKLILRVFPIGNAQLF